MEDLVDPFAKLKRSRVLITGHTGFKGSWLTKMLEQLEVTAFGLSLQPEENSLYTKLKFEKLADEKFADISDLNAVRSWVEYIKPDIVFHLAAQPLVLTSYRDPLETFKTNVIGSANLFEAIRLSGLDCPIVAVTTDKVYKNQETLIGYTEDSPLGGLDPYSSSKSAMEMAIIAWRNLNSQDTYPAIVSVRSGNVIGGGDVSAHRLLPDIISSLKRSEVIYLRHPLAVRPWQHVLDPLMGYMLVGERLLRKMSISESFNFGPSENSRLTVAEMTSIALSLWPGSALGWVKLESENIVSRETELLWLNSSRAFQELGWKSQLSAEQSVSHTIEWVIQESQLGANAITEIQISNYLKGWFA